MDRFLSLVTAATEDPISIGDARAHLRVDGSDEDILITSHVQAATAWVENYTRRALVTQTWELWMDAFPADGIIEMPAPPLRTVASVKYYDSAGVLQTLSASTYVVTAPAGPQAERGSIRLVAGASWPTTQDRPNTVVVRFDAGYGAGGDVPAAIRAAILLIVGELYKNREQSITSSTITKVPFAAESLLAPYRSLRFD